MAIYTTQLVAIALVVLSFTFSQGANCIARSRDLAEAIFNNTANENENWDNLRRAFFPPNHRENQIVTISYYYTSSTGNYSMEMFRWSWSPIIFFLYPPAIKALSLLVIQLDEGEANVNVTTPFCNITEETRLSLLNEFTTLVRGYVVNGYSSGQQLIDVHQIGYANYYNGQDYETRGDQFHIKKFFWMLIVSSAVASIFLPLGIIPRLKKHFASCYAANPEHPQPLNEKNTEHPPSLDAKNTEHPPSLDAKNTEHPPSLDAKNTEHPPSLDAKNTEHPPSLDAKNTEHPPSLDAKNTEHPQVQTDAHSVEPTDRTPLLPQPNMNRTVEIKNQTKNELTISVPHVQHDTNTVVNAEEKKYHLYLASLIASNCLGIYALVIDGMHICDELTRSNGSSEHYGIYIAWPLTLFVVLVVDFAMACIIYAKCKPSTCTSQINSGNNTRRSEGDGGTNRQNSRRNKTRGVVFNQSSQEVMLNATGPTQSSNTSKKKSTTICIMRVFSTTTSLYSIQVLSFHLIFIGLAFFSYPVQALGIIVVAFSVITMCTISLALVCFAFSRNKCYSILILIISLLICTAYAINLVSLVHVTEFFDYTDDFADNTVTSISTTLLSAVIATGPPFILVKEYDHLCEQIESLSTSKKFKENMA